MENKSLLKCIFVLLVLIPVVVLFFGMNKNLKSKDDQIARLVGKDNAVVEISFFGPTTPTRVMFDGVDGEIIWIVNEISAPGSVQVTDIGKTFLEIGRVGIGSSGGPDVLTVPPGADGYIKKTFAAPFNQ